MIAECGDLARAVEASLEVMEPARAEHTGLHVLPAIAQQLHRFALRLRDGRGFHHEVVGEPAPEATAATRDVQLDVLFRNAEQLGHCRLAAARHLRR